MESIKQYTLAGYKESSNKWYREGKFTDEESAKHFYKHHRKDFKQYSKLKLQVRTISLWQDDKDLDWLDEGV